MAVSYGISTGAHNIPVSGIDISFIRPASQFGHVLTARDDFSPAFAFMYSLLLFLKCFHWITADRVDYVSLKQMNLSNGRFGLQLTFRWTR